MSEESPANPSPPAGGTLEDWEFPGWGTQHRIADLAEGEVALKPLDSAPAHKLGQLGATAICGNDITSSCLYVAALCIVAAGKYAPLALLIVAAVLYLFRRIYGEVGTALPLNGGAYNVLLNTTSKAKASMAACLTILSYVATAVISASEAMHYAHSLYPDLHIFWATIALLGVFAFLNIVGISESAVVAIGIFLFHLVTLSVLVIAALIWVIGDPSVLSLNFDMPAPSGRGFLSALFFGFAAALLGISGFESSANFIEEQKPGVFIKTLRNMWIAVSFFNPVICVLALGLISIVDMGNYEESLLAEMGMRSAGPWLKYMVSIDAILVLSGAVLTSYVGVTGLVRRMSLDRCMPQFLLKENNWRKTNHWIIIAFFATCVSITYITTNKFKEVPVDAAAAAAATGDEAAAGEEAAPEEGVAAGEEEAAAALATTTAVWDSKGFSKGADIGKLAGVYTLSFLGVMGLFAVGNMLLKVKRGRLPRDVKASWAGVTVALTAVIIGIVGNLVAEGGREKVEVFGIYIIVVTAAVALMFLRIDILKVTLNALRLGMTRLHDFNKRFTKFLQGKVTEINSQVVVFFSNGDDISELNRAALYVLDNEQTRRLLIVYVAGKEEGEPPAELSENVRIIDRIYPQLRIDYVIVDGDFGPELIEKLSMRLEVPKNYMFIGCPGDHFPHKLDDLGGVRLIV